MNIRDPYIIKINNPLLKEKTEILLIILIKELGKYKKIAKGKINLYRSKMLLEQLYVEKYISLEMYPSQAQKAINDHIGTDIIATISSIGKIFMKAQIFDNAKEVDPLKIKKNRDDARSILTSNNEVLNQTKTLKKAIKKFKEENPDIVKAAIETNNLRIDNRHKSLNERITKDYKAVKKHLPTHSNRELPIEEGNEENIHITDGEINLDEIEDNHFNDGLSDISLELDKEKANMKWESEEENMFGNLQLVNSELDEIVNKLINVYQEKTEEK